MNKKCCICLDKMKDKGIVTFDCGHTVHLQCYINCLKNDTIFCPMCRQKIKQNVDYYNFINLKLNKLFKNFNTIKIKITEIDTQLNQERNTEINIEPEINFQ